MKFDFTYRLSPGEKSDIEVFYHSLDHVTIEQYPDWTGLEEGNFNYCFFTAREDGKIVCSAVIMERRARIFRSARIRFGPLFNDADVAIASIQAIHRHYRSQGYTFTTIQMAIPTGYIADYIEYRLNKAVEIRYYYNRDNWSSLALDLHKTEEEILKNFSKGHKSDIKKSEKIKISVAGMSTREELEVFCGIFIKMNKERGLLINGEDSISFFNNLYDFVQQQGKGRFLIVKDESGNILGGIVILFQGDTVRYFKGASDSGYRHIPILHSAIWEGIKEAKSMGFHYFDFWGYNHFVNEKDQVFYINRFKKGFGGSYTFYPKQMYFIYKPLMYRLFKLLMDLKGFLK